MIVKRIDAILHLLPRLKIVTSRANEGKLIFINADAPDLALADQLGKTLENMGYWVVLPYSGDTIRRVHSVHVPRRAAHRMRRLPARLRPNEESLG